MKARHRRKVVNVTMLQPGIGAGGGEFLAVISQLCTLGPCSAEIQCTCCMGGTDTHQCTTTYMICCAHSNKQLHLVDEAAQLIEESAKPCHEASNCTTHWLTDSP